MRFLTGLLGIAFVLVGLYFLGQNIIFTTQTSPYWWRDISAAGTVLSVTAGMTCLLFLGRDGQSLGWGLIGLAIVLAIASGGLIVRPTSLWTFFVAMISFGMGLKLMRT